MTDNKNETMTKNKDDIKRMTPEEIGDLQMLGNFIAEGLIRMAKGTKREDWELEEDEDQLIGELARCYTLQNIYLEREEYEKCAVIKLRIRTLNDKLGYDNEEEQPGNE